ncbi:MAG: thioredoxin-like domain-containing protein, partial [Pirellulales bacterium]
MCYLFAARARFPFPMLLALLLGLWACARPVAADEQPDQPATPAADEENQPTNEANEVEDRNLPAGDTPPFAQRLDAPPLDGGIEWINAAGPIHLKDLRGKFVVLDFWTYCCINCIHILPELKKLEQAYPNSIVVIGVHSAKFDQEKDSENIRNAVLRYDIEHPVVNDANFAIWRRYGISGWPGLRIIDPEGYLV